MPQPVDPADLSMPATPAADTLSWDWRGQPDLGRLATILARHGVTLRQVDTGSDQYEVEVSSTPAVAIHASGPLAGQPVGHGRVGWTDAARRWEWVAALRDGANRLLEPRGWASAADALRDRASVIASGALTPWADQPEPAAQPAVPSVAAPVAAGPHPDTPDRPGVLGRALLDEYNQVWLLVGEDDGWRCGTVTPQTRARIERYHEVREVLLVSPAAGRVLDAARQVAALDSLGDYQDWRRVAALHRELRAAVGAADGDQPPDPAERDQALHDALQEDAEMDAQLRAEDAAAPEPDSGPGWDRVWLLDCMVASLPGASYNESDLHDEARRQVLALLADRDRLERLGHEYEGMHRQKMAWEREAHRLRAELAEATAGWRRLALAVYPAAHPDWAGTCLCEDKDAHDYGCRQGHGPECDADCDGPCIRQLESLRALTAACTCGTSPMTYEGPESDCPVHGAVRAHTEAIRELAKLRAELATARRDAARSTLNYAGTTASSEMERDRLLRLAEDFGSGTRPVPGSPQPAPTGGRKDDAMTEQLHPFISPQTLALILPGSDDQRFTGEQWRNMILPQCPKCGTTIRADRVDVTYFGEMVRHYWFGRWECPNECDPRTPSG